MLKITTIEETRAIEEAADESGYSYQEMMENAGRSAADRALALLAEVSEPRITVLVGPGNNGGDGLVTGLLIAQDRTDADVRFYLLKDRDDDYIQTAKQADLFVVRQEDDHDKRLLRQMIGSADLVIDALFGIGVRLPIQGDARQLLQQANRALNERRRSQPDKRIITANETGQVPRPSPVLVMAIDCPSGLNCDTGDVDPNTIIADETVTFITAKIGQFFFPGAEKVGKLTVADIGISPKLTPLQGINIQLANSESVRTLLPERPVNSHKGTYGKTMIVAGSVNYVGAPALAAEAAYRSGTGLVTVGAPGNVVAALSGSLREVTWLMLPHNMGVISDSAADILLKEMTDYAVLLLGPGMGTEKTTREFIENLLTESGDRQPKPAKRSLGFAAMQAADNDDTDHPSDDDSNPGIPPLVIDADGLNLLAEIDNWQNQLPPETILTPHPGEMARLTNSDTATVQQNRLSLAREKAAEWQCTLVLKGAHTIIAAPDGNVTILPFKTDALATAGTGDVLAGLIAGFRAQGMNAYDAAVVGGYVHGIAGQLAQAATGSARSVTAGDVIQTIGHALAAIEIDCYIGHTDTDRMR